MKRVFILLLLVITSFGYSQTQVLEPGVYKANAKGQKLILRVFEDNKYELAVFQGKYVVENDTITFLSREPNSSPFLIKVNKEAPFSSTLKIKFKPQNLLYASRNIYIGTQKEDDAVIEYKPLSDFVNKRTYSYADRQKDFKIDVDKAKYVYLVNTNRNLNAVVSKFQIDQNDNEIEVEYDGSFLQTIELKGIVNPETKKLSVMEGRTQRDILEFEKDNGTISPTNDIMPIAVLTEKEWKKNHGFVQDVEFDSSFLEKRQNTKYTFKHAVIKTYSEGLKSIEKSPEKFLVVIADNRKEAKTEFNEFIQKNEKRLSRSMRKGYNAKIDLFNFYLATEKDKAVIANLKIKDKTALIFLNSDGQLIYHTEGTINANSNLFNSYYSVYDELDRANGQFKLDKLVANKKATLMDFKKSLFEIIKSKQSSDYDDVVVAVDTAAAVADSTIAMPYEEDYLRAEFPENLYSIKTPKEIIAGKWNSLVDFYTKNNTYDEDFIEMCKKELLNNGFTQKLYGGQVLITETDFKILDYLYKNYNEIVKNESKNKNPLVENEYDEEYEMDREFMYQNTIAGIAPTLSTFFQKMTAESAHLHRSNQIKLIGYYKSYLQLSGFKLTDFTNYLQRIRETNLSDNSLYFKEYGEFFDALVSKNPSLIESLDEMYAAQKNNYITWIDFKHDFSRLANNVAWVVVESKNNDANAIQKAVKWSETSLNITKNEYHYLDTLAQLYYKNNEKEKAIATEQKAIEALNINDKERKENYTEVLESMKNGTY